MFWHPIWPSILRLNGQVDESVLDTTLLDPQMPPHFEVLLLFSAAEGVC